MKRVLILMFVFSMVASSIAFGASARWQALGNEHRFIIDTSNYGPYPARVHQFTNAVWLIPRSAFGDNDISAGLLMKLNDKMTGAFHFNIPPPDRIAKLNSTLAGFKGTNDRLAGLELRAFPDLFWSMKSGNMTIAARADLAMDKSSTTTPETSASAMATDIAVGALMPTPLGDLDLGVGVGIQKFSDDAGGKITDSTGGFNVSFDARLNKPKGKVYTIVPILNVKYGADPTESGKTKSSYMGGDIGLGLRAAFDPAQGLPGKKMVVTGLVLGYNAVTTKPTTGDQVKATTLAPKVIAGCELPVKTWLILRGGANATLSSKSNGASSMDVTYYYNTGFRIMYSGFVFDMILARDIFHRGPYFVSGSGKDGSNLGTNICLTYAF